MIQLDTSAYLEFIKGTSKGEKVRRHCEEQELCVSAVTANEIYAGEEDPCELELLEHLRIIPFGKEEARRAAEFERQLIKSGSKIPKLDTFIASTASCANATLITTDRHFKNISKLHVILVE